MEIDKKLLKAAAERNKKMAEEALRDGADPNAKSEAGYPALQTALHAGREAKAVCRVNALLNDKSGEEVDKEVKAAEANMEAMANLLLGAGADPNWKDPEGWTELMGCSMQGEHSLARKLLDAGAGTSEQEKEGLTALMLAAERGDKEMCDLLLASGADPRALARDGSMALDLAASEEVRKAIWRGMTQKERDELDRSASPGERKGKPLKL